MDLWERKEGKERGYDQNGDLSGASGSCSDISGASYFGGNKLVDCAASSVFSWDNEEVSVLLDSRDILNKYAC